MLKNLQHYIFFLGQGKNASSGKTKQKKHKKFLSRLKKKLPQDAPSFAGVLQSLIESADRAKRGELEKIG